MMSLSVGLFSPDLLLPDFELLVCDISDSDFTSSVSVFVSIFRISASRFPRVSFGRVLSEITLSSDLAEMVSVSELFSSSAGIRFISCSAGKLGSGFSSGVTALLVSFDFISRRNSPKSDFFFFISSPSNLDYGINQFIIKLNPVLVDSP